MPAGVDLLPLALPGHDGRLNEPPATDLTILANTLREELSRFALDHPFVLMGHSMGALLAFELARSLRAHQHAMPQLLVLTGCRAPHAIVIRQPLHNLPDRELLAALQERYGGIPTVVRDNPELWKVLLPALRADFQMIETYTYTEEPPLDVPMLVLGGTDDTAVLASQLMEWRKYTTQDCSVRQFPGSHFFVFSGGRTPDSIAKIKQDEPTPAMRTIFSRLEQCVAASTADGRS
jgi:medium-chain acyl-[acyl-carrier-protein] hydrolase